MKKTNKKKTLAATLTGVIIILLVIFSLVVSSIGSIGFANALKREYATSTFHMAQTAALLVNGDNIEKYLSEGTDEEYDTAAKNLNLYCEKMYVSLIYVIAVDKSDYKHFRSVFNLVNNEVGDTAYTPWELGFERETTNSEYRQKYRKLYEGKSEYETVYRIHPIDSKPHITTLVPVQNAKGEVTALLCIQRPMSEINKATLPFVLRILLSAAIISLVAAVLVSQYSQKQFVLPIRKLSEKAACIARGDLSQEVPEESRIEEIAALSGSIHTMEEDMRTYIENLTTITAERERIGAELSIAQTIQENALPTTFPAFPEREEFEVYASMTPAKEVGGDFYNFFLVDDDHLAVIIADVSGKGVPAALFMMVSNILISDRTNMGGTPAEVLEYVNTNICRHNTADMFVTVWLGILEISTGKMIAANAGHDHPAVYRKGGYFEIVKNRHGLVVGAMEGAKYHDFELRLEKGDKLFLFTDGLPEATDAQGNMLTMEGLLHLLNAHASENPESIIEGVNAGIETFVGDAAQFDDMTMLCLELKDEQTPLSEE